MAWAAHTREGKLTDIWGVARCDDCDSKFSRKFLRMIFGERAIRELDHAG
jgi:hypothetical protein